MNIPEHILQDVADAAFLSSNGGMMDLLTCNKKKNHVFWHEERYARRAVIQHALDNPALAPWLNVPQAWPPVGEYTDEELAEAASQGYLSQDYLGTPRWLRAFLAALPRRESPALADAMPPAEPAAQVPLGPKDVPPGSVIRSKDQPDTCFWTVSQVWERGFYLRGECVDWHLAMERMEINTSIPDTGRWDANAWRPCSKPAGKEVAK